MNLLIKEKFMAVGSFEVGFERYQEFHAIMKKMLPRWLSGKEYACNAGDVGSTPGSGRRSGEGNGDPLQYSHLGDPTERGACQTAVHGIVKELDTTERLNNNLKMQQ